MRILVVSDIHANLTALDAVLEDAGMFDAVWCLGDLVGYGPDPNECVARIREFPDLLCIGGNHDKAAIGDLSLDAFNGEARRALEWTHRQLTPETIQFLRELCGCQRASDVEFHRSCEHACRQGPAFALELFPNNNVQVGKVSGDNNDDDHQY